MTRSVVILGAGVITAMLASSTLPALAAGDPAKGQQVFQPCRACHQIGENARNLVGPQLNGLIGRKAGSVPGYNYSEAYKSLDKVWDEANFRIYIKDPRGVTPGTKMIFPGIKDDDKIDDLIAFLRQYGPDGKKVE